MSSNPPHPFSPIHRRMSFSPIATDGGRWTVDNSESRIRSFLATQSPSRSILKGSNTPMRFTYSSQEKRNEQLRRVSFARDAHLRVYDQNESPDITSRGIPNLFEESQPDFRDNALNSPASNLLLPHFSESSSSERKRRPDLFGSPKAVQKSPKRRAGGAPPTLLVRVHDEYLDEDDVGNSPATDLTRYLSIQPGNVKRNIFEEDEDDDDEEEEEEERVQRVEEQPKPDIPEKTMTDQTDDMIITQEIDHSHADPIDNESSIPYIEEETMLITQEMPPAFESSPLNTPDRHRAPATRRIESPQRVQTASHQRTLDRNRSSTPPLRKRSTHGTPDRNNRPTSTPERAPNTSTYHASPIRSSVLTPLRESNAVYSEQRSFYAHRGTPLQSSRFNDTETVELESVFDVGGDNVDIMEEEYSQLYNTMHDGIPAAQNMPLSDFLGYVGITFPDDTPAKELRRRSNFISNYGIATNAEKAFAAALTLPELKLYKKEIEGLHQLIHKSQEIIDKIDRDISDANPQFFAEYLDSEVDIRTKTEKRLKEIKTYATLKSIQQWYNVWIKSLKTLPIILKENLEKLDLDTKEIPKFLDLIRPKLAEANEYKLRLARVLKDCKVQEQEYDIIDHEKLHSFEKEIDYQRITIQDLTQETQSLEKEEQELFDRDNTAGKAIALQEETIRKAESIIAANTCITVTELIEEKDKFERNSEIGGWKMEIPEDDVVHMALQYNIDITINQAKLVDKQTDAILIRMLDSRDRSLGPVAELIHGLAIVVKDKWEMDEIMQDIAIYWNRVMMIQQDLSSLTRRFWVQIESLDYADDVNNAGFSCQITVQSYVGKAKFTVSFVVKPKDILAYPAIDISTLGLVIHYGGVEHDELKEIIEKELFVHGMNDIVETLKGISERIAIP